MTTPKRSSYPSRQLRGGPAPLASFEDLSDEISSPEEPATLPLSPDAETEEDTKTCSEGATPSTPRVLAQTPSTPLALDGLSAMGTPDSFDHLDVFPGSSSRPTTPLPPPPLQEPGDRFSPLFGRRSRVTTPEPTDHRTSNSSLDGGARRPPATPSPRSARKIFTMAFFKPREDRSPSPTASPRRTSPVASPKSPRRASPFAGLFKGPGAKEEPDATASPTKKRSHFPYFLRPKEERPPPQEPASPAEHGKKTRVFGHLFARAHHRDPGEKSQAVAPPQTPEDEEWASTPPAVQATAKTAVYSREPAVVLPPAITEQAEGTSWLPVAEARCDQGGLLPRPPDDVARIFESTQDILGAEAAAPYDPSLRLGLSPSADEGQGAASATAPAAQEEEEPDLDLAPDPPAVALESPESEAEVPEADPAILKAVLKGKEQEAETLLREDSFDAEEFPVPDVADKAPPEKETSRHRDKLAAFRVNPVDRPRSAAPVSFASLEAYINKVEPSADKTKLKVVLPGEEFEPRERQPKKAVYKSWFEFCEVGLQSPRSRRRQLSARSPSSFPERQEVVVQPADERRAESVDLGAMGASDAWASFEPEDSLCDCRDGPPHRLSGSSSRSSSPDNYGATELNPALLKDEEVEPLVQAEELTEETPASSNLDYATDPYATQIPQAADPGMQSSIRSLPDCVFSVGSEPEAPPCWANNVMDLLASLPSPKQEPACVTNGGGRVQDARTGFEPPMATMVADHIDGM